MSVRKYSSAIGPGVADGRDPHVEHRGDFVVVHQASAPLLRVERAVDRLGRLERLHELLVERVVGRGVARIGVEHAAGPHQAADVVETQVAETLEGQQPGADC